MRRHGLRTINTVIETDHSIKLENPPANFKIELTGNIEITDETGEDRKTAISVIIGICRLGTHTSGYDRKTLTLTYDEAAFLSGALSQHLANIRAEVASTTEAIHGGAGKREEDTDES